MSHAKKSEAGLICCLCYQSKPLPYLYRPMARYRLCLECKRKQRKWKDLELLRVAAVSGSVHSGRYVFPPALDRDEVTDEKTQRHNRERNRKHAEARG